MPGDDLAQPVDAASALRRRAVSAGVAALAFGTALFVAAHHPLQPALAMALVVLWAALCARFPSLWLLVVPAGLPWFDFAPWTGGILWSEFDLLVLGALAGGHAARAISPSPRPWPAARIHLALGLLLALGLWRGLTDGPVVATGDAGPGPWFADAFSSLNALRVSKAWIALLLTAPLLDAALRRGCVLATHLGPGLLIGATVAAAGAVWERATYPGLWDLSEPYRSTSMFWEMHVGGAAIDAYLALVVAWVAWGLWRARGWVSWCAAAVLAVLLGYAALTTFSRGVYLAAAVSLVTLAVLVPHPRKDWRFHAMRFAMMASALVVMAAAVWWAGLPGLMLAWVGLGALWLWRQRHRWHLPWRRAAVGTLVLALAAEAVAVFGPGSFMSGRVARVDQDYGSRLAHWQRGIGLLHTPGEWLFGLGAGRLPSHYAAFTREGALWGSARWVDGAADLSGPRSWPTVAGQFVLAQRVPALRESRVALTLRTTQGARLRVQLCEAHLLYDRACQGAAARVPPLPSGASRTLDLPLHGPPLRRPAMLMLSVTHLGGRAQVDDVVLSGDGRAQWLRNGDFSQGFAHWLPVARHHFLPWHIDNLALELLIERGVLGLLVGLGLAGVALHRGWRAVRHGQPEAAFVTASLLGLLSVGLVSSVLDVPRVAWLAGLMLMLLLLLLPTATRPSSAAPLSPAPRRTPTDSAAPSPAG